ncbi:MAG: quinolinate synthase NadA [Pseudomonadota bacterium]
MSNSADISHSSASEISQRILELKKKRSAVLLAHYYQDVAIQDVADFVGDSLELSRAAAKTSADVICFAGVHFMAETAKILNPTKTVLIPDLEAGCSLADECPPAKFASWLKQYPGHLVVSYINCSAAVKALSDVICTSSNAVRIIASFPRSQKLVFAPDQNLGRFVQQQTGREDMVLWPGSCVVHSSFSERRLLALRADYPGAEVIAHPECPAAVLQHASFIGSTSALIRHVSQSNATTFIVATEAGILHAMGRAAPGKHLIPAPPEDLALSANVCRYMRRNTLERVYLALRDLTPRVDLDESLRKRAETPIARMMELSI